MPSILRVSAAFLRGDIMRKTSYYDKREMHQALKFMRKQQASAQKNNKGAIIEQLKQRLVKAGN